MRQHAQGFEDFLQSPLQPLMDNLESCTYEVFEKDPIKYMEYGRAIQRALTDLVPIEEAKTKTLVLMVLGAGRGKAKPRETLCQTKPVFPNLFLLHPNSLMKIWAPITG